MKNKNKIGNIATAEWAEIIQTSPGSNNLVLERGILTKGQSYVFELLVYEYTDENTTVFVGKDIKPIDVNYGPIILKDSFIISHDCTNLTFNSYNDWLQTQFYMTISADAQNLPMLYQFSYIFVGMCVVCFLE